MKYIKRLIKILLIILCIVIIFLYFRFRNTKIIADVPYLNQFTLGYPTGCEAVSATMVLNYHGYDVSAEEIVNLTPTDEIGKQYDETTNTYYAANPFKLFVGHPTKMKNQGSYGCFAEPIEIAMKAIAREKVKNISNCNEELLFSYIDKDCPIVIWGIKNAKDPEEGVIWKYTNEEGSFKEIKGEHCFVLIGYDERYVYLNDPSAGRYSIQPREKFISNWKELYSQAIVIEK